MRSLLRIALPLLYLLSPLVPLAFYFQYNWYSFFHLYSLTVAAGVAGYIYLLNQFITGGRLKVLDRIYGYDRVLTFHRRMSALGLVLILFHHEAKGIPADLQTHLGAIALLLFLFVIATAIIFLSDSLAKVPFFFRIRQFVRQRLKLQYQHFRLIHNITAIAMLVALVHVLLASSTQESPYRFAIMLLWYCGATSAYVWHKFIRPRKNQKNPFQIKRIIHETKNIITLEIGLPVDTHRKDKRFRDNQFVYQPGQFCFIRFLTGKMPREEHPYTISSTPHNQNSISITIKNCGDWSAALAEKAAPGDYIEIDGAYGHFSYTQLKKNETAPLIFVAGGIGITPFMSMLNTLKHEQSNRKVLLVWKTRTEEELFLTSRIAEWKKAMPNLRTALFCSQNAAERISASDICSSTLTHAETETGHYFLCGPVGMIRDVRSQLKKREVHKSRIYSENFAF